MSEDFNYCHIVGRTDVGRKRAANEDNMSNAITQNGLVAVVCDGMGGHVGGATASRIAVNCIIEHLNNVYYDDPRIAIGESIDAANRAILHEANEHPELTGMGSTCVLLLVRGGKVYIGHVGDSRIYLVRSKKIAQLTKDHSYVQMLVDCGEITKEQAEHHPRKNEITNALGIPNMSPATVADDAIIPEAGDCFVLCSDGLSGMVSDDIINKVVSKQTEMNAQERVDRLVTLANDNGGVDNITVQLVEFPVSPAIIATKKAMPLWLKIGVPVLLGLSLCAGCYFLVKHFGKKDHNDQEQTSVEQTKDPLIRETKLLDIPFKKNDRILELSFGENYLELKRDGNVVYRETNTSFDQASLTVDSPDVKVEFNNSLLSFTDKNPGATISFAIMTIDKSMLYKFIVGIKQDGVKGALSLPSSATQTQGGVSSQSNQKGNASDTPKASEEKPVFVSISIGYDELPQGSRLLLNYSATPKLIFNSKEYSIPYSISEIVEKDLVFDSLYWENNSRSKQLIFKYKGEVSNGSHSFEIPFISKEDGKTMVLSVELKSTKNNESISPKDTSDTSVYQEV